MSNYLAVVNKGFTLIELLVTVTILAILLTVGVPSFREYIAQQRVQTVALDLMVALRFARSEAIKRSSDITIEESSDGWSRGWEVKVDSSTPPLLRKDVAENEVTITTDQTSLSFSRAGRASSNMIFTICDPQNYVKDERVRTVNVDSSGKAFIERRGECGDGS